MQPNRPDGAQVHVYAGTAGHSAWFSDDLDAQVKFEESRTGVSDPAHFNYSLSAKSARARRDNLLRSIGELKDQLKLGSSEVDAWKEKVRELDRMFVLLAEKTGEFNLAGTMKTPETTAPAAPHATKTCNILASPILLWGGMLTVRRGHVSSMATRCVAMAPSYKSSRKQLTPS